MEQYQLLDNGFVQRLSDMASIPPIASNQDYAQFLIDKDAGAEVRPPVAPPVPVPQSISDRQFFQQLAIVGTITQSEALAAVKVGTIPAILQGFIDAIADPTQRFSANMLLAGATVFERNHPLTQAIGAAQGRTSEDMDAFFRAAATL